MNLINALLTIIGLTLFETVNSIDNVIINAEILSKLPERMRKLFLTWGLFFAVFVVRGFLPLIIIYLSNPSIGVIGTLTASFTADPQIKESIEATAPTLLMGGGVFLLFIFFHWLFLEEKNFCVLGEKFFYSNGVWFYAVISIILVIVVWFSITINPIIALGAVIGSSAFFISNGFKQNAELKEKDLLSSNSSALSKLVYLEIIDTTFSIDGVLGSFAFTLAVPLILIGNGIGAILIRQLTLKSSSFINNYVYIKNGAMYSLLGLSIVMISDGFKIHLPDYIAPLSTIIIIGYFFFRSHLELKNK